ncbi:MAG: hypothetical protein ACREV6_19415 [Clostridium sp.]|uniref:hypothetical protein n=1 Tax=Clostridium sp. TaxID=1506 RepID=UPI003D6CF9CB
MAIGDATPKKLFQGALSAMVAVLYTVPTGSRTQIVEIWSDNQNATTDRKINIYAHGTTNTNRLSHNIPITKDTGISISDNKIVLGAGEVFAMSQDVGTDVIITIYGIEEVVA